jgi:hypothetical protein
MSDWRKLLDRTLDGDSLSVDEIAELEAALNAADTRGQAREWLAFESALRGHLQNETSFRASRERLIARAILRAKHIEIAGDAQSALSITERRAPIERTIRTRRLWMQSIVVMSILLIVIGTFWPESSSSSYAGPIVDGDFHVLGVEVAGSDRQIERGDRLVSGGHGAKISIGRYCEVDLAAHTDVSVYGEPWREVIELHQGRLHARVTPNQGQFQIQTPLGSVTVQGTEFETIVEYPNGIPGDLSMSPSKKVVLTVAVLSGAVVCEVSDRLARLESGDRQVFAEDVDSRKTSGVVTATTDSTVTLKVGESESVMFHTGDNKLTIHEAGQLLAGDKVTISWVEEDNRRWIRDIEGEGILEGTVTALGDAWLEVQTESKRKLKLRAPWRGGNPADGGGPDRDVVKKIGTVRVGDEVAVTWEMPEGKRVVDVRLRKATDLTKAPPELYGLSGRVVGRLVSKDVEKGELTLKIVEVDRVWKNNKASNPKSAAGRTLKIDGVFGKFLDVLLTLKERDGVQIEVKHVRGDGLTFLGEELKKVDLPEEAATAGTAETPEPEPSEDGGESPAGLQGFRGILIGELVSKDVEQGTLVFRMEKVKRVWKANKAPAPEKSVGRQISVEGISGKFLDTLLVLEIGDRIEVEAFHVRGQGLEFPGEWLRKAE